MFHNRGKNGDGSAVPVSSKEKRYTEGFGLPAYLIFIGIMLIVMILCICVGSVNVPLKETIRLIWSAVARQAVSSDMFSSIILAVRVPRVLCVALSGAALSVCGAAMQGLLKNPLADGSTLGVSSGAALGAVLAIALEISIPFLPFASTMLMAMLFAFLSLMLILSLAYRLDFSLATNTIILIGVIFSMFVSSVMSLVIAFSGDHLKSITYWTMGSLAGSNYRNALVLLIALLICGTVIMLHARELNAFAIGEENARHIGVNVKRVKLTIMITVSVLIGVCVSIGGTIAFVGLVTPHMVRMITGPNHKRILPASIFGGATFLMLCDLVARVIINPIELPIGVVTSLIGAVLFVVIFYQSRRKSR